jgi:hypothetical protein
MDLRHGDIKTWPTVQTNKHMCVCFSEVHKLNTIIQVCDQRLTGITEKLTACTGKLNLWSKMVENNLILSRHAFRFCNVEILNYQL